MAFKPPIPVDIVGTLRLVRPFRGGVKRFFVLWSSLNFSWGGVDRSSMNSGVKGQFQPWQH